MQATKQTITCEAAAPEHPALELLVDLVAMPAPAPAPVLAYGTVADGAKLAVALEDGARPVTMGETLKPPARPARRAKSCLVAPERGDRVLCSVDGASVYVLAVLDGAPATRVATEGSLELSAPELSLVADSMNMRAKAATVTIEQLRLLGRSIEAVVADKVALVTDRVEARASRFLQRAKQAFRFVDELEQVRAGNYDLRAEGLAAVRGENTIVSARVLAKLDGEQVKIG